MCSCYDRAVMITEDVFSTIIENKKIEYIPIAENNTCEYHMSEEFLIYITTNYGRVNDI